MSLQRYSAGKIQQSQTDLARYDVRGIEKYNYQEEVTMITMENVCKSYKVAKRNAGFKEACKSLFKREYEEIHALQNVSFTIQAGTRVAGTNYGLLAGTVSGEAVLDGVKILKSALLIDSSCYFGVDDYSIGLVCGIGGDVIPGAEISCAVVGDDPDRLSATVEGNTVTLTFAE